MKIKDAITKTGLTDKAIRLYIDSGLVAPSIDESYSGRKSIDFSDRDVERLNNIAVLRKAGFSIADIKEIVESNEKAKAVVERFIKQTENSIQHETEIIRKLKSINTDESVTMDIICKSLSASIVKSEIPREDMKLTFRERSKKNFALAFSAGVMILSLIKVTILLVYYKTEFLHLKYEEDMLPVGLFAYGGIVIIFILSLIMLVINYNYVPVGKKSKIIDRTTGIISMSIILIGVISFFTSFFGTFFLSGFFCSQTNNPDDYLIIDSFVEYEMGEEIKSIFPNQIPESASVIKDRIYDDSYPFTTKYYYKYSNSIDTNFDIVAEWKIEDTEFEKAVAEIRNKENYTVMIKGDWNCYVLIDYICAWNDENKDIWSDSWEHDDYDILFFAYNTETKNVRYVAAHAVDSYSYGPYYLTLDW